MLKALGFLFKCILFSICVLVLGNWLRWDGKTISDQVRLQMSHAEESGLVDTFNKWARQVTHDASQGFKKKVKQSNSSLQNEEEEISSSERQKLKSLMKELNSSHSNR